MIANYRGFFWDFFLGPGRAAGFWNSKFSERLPLKALVYMAFSPKPDVISSEKGLLVAEKKFSSGLLEPQKSIQKRLLNSDLFRIGFLVGPTKSSKF